MGKLITITNEVYNRLKLYTNDLPPRSKQKISFSEAINKLLNFREGD
jgi:predicted CopG family antitoxin